VAHTERSWRRGFFVNFKTKSHMSQERTKKNEPKLNTTQDLLTPYIYSSSASEAAPRPAPVQPSLFAKPPHSRRLKRRSLPDQKRVNRANSALVLSCVECACHRLPARYFWVLVALPWLRQVTSCSREVSCYRLLHRLAFHFFDILQEAQGGPRKAMAAWNSEAVVETSFHTQPISATAKFVRFVFFNLLPLLSAFMACSYFHVIVQALSSLVPLNQAAAVARAFSPASVMSSPHEFFVLLNLSPEVLKSHRNSGTCKV